MSTFPTHTHTPLSDGPATPIMTFNFPQVQSRQENAVLWCHGSAAAAAATWLASTTPATRLRATVAWFRERSERKRSTPFSFACPSQPFLLLPGVSILSLLCAAGPQTRDDIAQFPFVYVTGREIRFCHWPSPVPRFCHISNTRVGPCMPARGVGAWPDRERRMTWVVLPKGVTSGFVDAAMRQPWTLAAPCEPRLLR